MQHNIDQHIMSQTESKLSFSLPEALHQKISAAEEQIETEK